MNIQFTRLTENDLPTIKEIYDWYVLNSTATFHTEPLSTDELRGFIYVGHPVYRSFKISDDGKPCGYCFITQYKNRPAFDRTAEVTIYLKNGCAGKGLGRRALAFLEEQAADAGIKNLIGIITGENMASISLFARAGYVQCALFRNVGEKFGRVLDVVAMQKEIG